MMPCSIFFSDASIYFTFPLTLTQISYIKHIWKIRTFEVSFTYVGKITFNDCPIFKFTQTINIRSLFVTSIRFPNYFKTSTAYRVPNRTIIIFFRCVLYKLILGN
nr:MAG TPA: hypothetical protein [Bacteriophage sp.]DAX13761.1 MAG TPA: hypothetical protein [Bacteriophage sp.]